MQAFNHTVFEEEEKGDNAGASTYPDSQNQQMTKGGSGSGGSIL